ncbi:MAG: hypothetical protein JNL38_40750 [Myxococcales bacterium]|nr:hypothetical protein [Myxococcales bacterium]
MASAKRSLLFACAILGSCVTAGCADAPATDTGDDELRSDPAAEVALGLPGTWRQDVGYVPDEGPQRLTFSAARPGKPATPRVGDVTLHSRRCPSGCAGTFEIHKDASLHLTIAGEQRYSNRTWRVGFRDGARPLRGSAVAGARELVLLDAATQSWPSEWQELFTRSRD